MEQTKPWNTKKIKIVKKIVATFLIFGQLFRCANFVFLVVSCNNLSARDRTPLEVTILLIATPSWSSQANRPREGQTVSRSTFYGAPSSRRLAWEQRSAASWRAVFKSGLGKAKGVYYSKLIIIIIIIENSILLLPKYLLSFNVGNLNKLIEKSKFW